MEGFGKGFKTIKYTGQLIHSTNLDWICGLMQNFNSESTVCFSTKGSIDRGIEIIYMVIEKEGKHTEYDADAGRNYGYDEFRCEMTEEEIQEPERILVDQETYDYVTLETASDDTEEQEEINRIFEDYRLLQMLEIKA